MLVGAARLLLDACAVAAVGLAVLHWLVRTGHRRDVAAVRTAADRAAVVVAGAWAAAAVVALWLQAAELSDQPAGRVGMRTVVDYATGFGSGAGLLVTASCAVAIGVGSSTGRLPAGLLAVLAVLGLLPAPITGHAASAASAWSGLAVVSVAVHATAAAAWIGGLAALVVAGPRRGLLAVALPRFSRLAGWCLAVLAASGVLTAAMLLDSVPALLTTGYGRVVVAKAVVLLAVALAGLTMRSRVLPAVLAQRRASWRPLAGVELSLMAAALGLAATLTRLGP